VADSRFYEDKGPVSAASIADRVGGRLSGRGEADVRLAASLDTDDLAGALVFVAERGDAEALGDRRAAAILVKPSVADLVSGAADAVIEVDDPRLAFARALPALHVEKPDAYGDAGVHPTADVAPDAVVHPGAFVGADAVVGPGCVIDPGAVVGRGVVLGARVRIGAGASVFAALVGDDCRIFAGARIGEAGFGFAPTEGGLLRIPQIGRVVIGDQVEIGANATVDRGALGDTTIGFGTKIDNLVQVGHNCRIGRFCILAGMAGVSGSTVLGDGVMLGGQAGVADHLTLGDGARLAANAGLMHDMPPGETWCGAPARPIKTFMRETVAVSRLVKKKK